MIREVENIQHNRVILFTRYPVPGQAKTRLIPCLGAKGAAELQKMMTEFAVKEVSRTGIPLQIRFDGGTHAQMRAWLGAGYAYVPQGDGDLGERMARAGAEAFAQGVKKVIIVGADCPDNRTANLLDAIKALDNASCVIGPAADGGYYLIGLREPRPDLFRDVAWGTASVLRQTIAKINACPLLPVLGDVDEPGDIPPKISVIIPALNEEKQVGGAVQSAMEGFNVETIVADGGSGDRTREIAAQAGAKVIASAPGRALQMNMGAQQATGDLFLFLHADSSLPPAWDCHVRKVIKQPRTALGYFTFAIDGTFSGRRWIEWGANMRARLLKSPYGDQGLFLRREDFFDWGGFADVPILEDVLLVKQAKKRGRLRGATAVLTTSGRRWVTHGVIRTTLINQAVLVLAWLGADPRTLGEAYRAGSNPFFSVFTRQTAANNDSGQ
jgi:rSAM/selenodomain-associated transferase 2/rSAM/selenodomain-associated transferase 1